MSLLENNSPVFLSFSDARDGNKIDLILECYVSSHRPPSGYLICPFYNMNTRDLRGVKIGLHGWPLKTQICKTISHKTQAGKNDYKILCNQNILGGKDIFDIERKPCF